MSYDTDISQKLIGDDLFIYFNDKGPERLLTCHKMYTYQVMQCKT